jgi:hypothetical protein
VVDHPGDESAAAPRGSPSVHSMNALRGPLTVPATGGNDGREHATGQSTVTDPMPDTRFGHAEATLADGSVLVAGGQHSPAGTVDPNIRLSSAALIDPVTGKVSPTGSMALGRQTGPAAALLPDRRVLVVGGRTGKVSAEVYVP